MKLTYHQGRNFGDALNPIIFNELFPGLFDDDKRVLFIGIGSLFGLKKGAQDTLKRIYFSTGFADGAPGTYGTRPTLGPSDDVICVRGPLTAEILDLPKEKAIADGAILLPHLFNTTPLPTRYEFAYMPHAGSLDLFDGWRDVLEKCGIELIDPREDPWQVIDKLQRTGTLFAEAMHGAILADSIGIPWVPVSAYPTINSFKWRDYCASMELTYDPVRIKPLYNARFIEPVISNKLASLRSRSLQRAAGRIYMFKQDRFTLPRVMRTLSELRSVSPVLSDRTLLRSRTMALLEKCEIVRARYGRLHSEDPSSNASS